MIFIINIFVDIIFILFLFARLGTGKFLKENSTWNKVIGCLCVVFESVCVCVCVCVYMSMCVCVQ